MTQPIVSASNDWSGWTECVEAVSVRNMFAGWYPRTPDELSGMWDRAVFVPDTNILLHCLRRPADIREELLRILGLLGQSLWIPYQIGLEFHRHRLDIETAVADGYDYLLKDYEAAFTQAREKLRQLRHPAIDVEKELSALDHFLADAQKRLSQAKARHPAGELATAVSRISALFEGKVGPKPTPEALLAIRREGEDRYSRRAPPGYKDAKKDAPESDKFGDLIIWKDLIAKARSEGRPVIFITDDAKEDWWQMHHGRKLGPRPELFEEFRAIAEQDFHIYDLGQFLRVAAGRYREITNDRVEKIERSVREDEAVRLRAEEERADIERQRRILALENERDVLISVLTGIPGTYTSQHLQTIDRTTVRARLSEIDSELALARASTEVKPSQDH